ncbi:sodium-transporting two-sector ATPase [Candidatus Saccharibacteria bacterium]|nr:sodium-transporting two-sector ATPase [Candidatus Saccharibacteria bacterium]
MTDDVDQHFQKLVDAGRPVGEVIGINNFLIEIKGLQPVSTHSLVIFENGNKGFVQHILETRVTVLNLGSAQFKIGMLAAVGQEELTAKVGKDFIGRVVSVSGDPLDGKGPIAADANWPVFGPAPPIYERELLNTQLETGVTLIDCLFPIVRGQRLAILGDSKSGKSTLATQIAINQRSTDQIVIYVMIAKRRSDIDILLQRLSDSGVMDKTIVVVSTIFDSLVSSYLAPYTACAMAEYLWQVVGQDALLIYDDLTAHAHVYREISLLSGVSPGRDSYPGDIFHAHSSLLERAGKLKKNHKSLTVLPLVLTESGDISSYLPTNIMSITDGQWVLDMEVFRSGLRPAVNVGLSVTRVGAVGQNEHQRWQASQVFKILADYRKAQEFTHFGAEMTLTTQQLLTIGAQINQLFTQIPGETYGLLAEQLMLDSLLSGNVPGSLNINTLKKLANDTAAAAKPGSDYQNLLAAIKSGFGAQGTAS